jgi:hypothetical protein
VIVTLLTVSVVVGLMAITIAVGRSILQRYIPCDSSATEEVLLALTVGVGVVATLMLIVAVVAGPHWYTLWGGLAAIAVATWRSLAGTPSLLRRASNELVHSWPQGTPRRAGVAAVIMLAIAILLLTLTPPVDYDALAYHLRVPQQWLAQGRVFLPDDNYHTAFVGVNELLYLPLLSIGASSAPQVLNGILTLMVGVGVFAMAKVVAGARTAGLAFVLLFGSAILFVTGTTPMVDVTLALVLVSATLALVLAWDRPGGSRLVLIAGALTGVAMGVKYLGILYAVAMAPVFLMVAWRLSNRSIRRSAFLLSATVAAVFLVAAPWALKNVVLLGNPVFPFLSAPRVEPWLGGLYPELTPHEVNAEGLRALVQIRKPFSLRRFILAPSTITSGAYSEASAPFWVLFLAPFALMALPRWKATAVLAPPLIFGALLLSCWPYTNLRYLIPMIPGLTIGAAVIILLLHQRLGRIGRVSLIATVAILALPAPLTILHMSLDRASLAYVSGRESRQEYLHHYWETAQLMPAVEWVNANVDTSARVILLFEARGYYFKPHVLEDIDIRNWVYLSPFAHAPECLRATGATFVLVNNGMRAHFEGMGLDPFTLGWGTFEGVRHDCLRLRYERAEISIYQLGSQRGLPTESPQ